jgi:hypothetical protein
MVVRINESRLQETFSAFSTGKSSLLRARFENFLLENHTICKVFYIPLQSLTEISVWPSILITGITKWQKSLTNCRVFKTNFQTWRVIPRFGSLFWEIQPGSFLSFKIGLNFPSYFQSGLNIFWVTKEVFKSLLFKSNSYFCPFHLFILFCSILSAIPEAQNP